MVFCNAPSERFYNEEIKPKYQEYKILKEIRYNGNGCFDLLKELLSLSGKPGYEFVKLRDQVSEYDD